MTAAPAETHEDAPSYDRSRAARVWYSLVRWLSVIWLCATGGLRASGRENLPATGGALLVSNHVSFLDVFVLGIPLNRPLNYVARSTLFLPVLGPFLHSIGAFPIQREGMGASGLKETLRRLRRGGVVLLFPEGTRSPDGRLAPIKSGIAVIARKAKVPVVPAAVAGTFEAWPRDQLFPSWLAVRVHYGPAILPAELAGLGAEAVTGLIQERIADCQREAASALARGLGVEPILAPDQTASVRKTPLGGRPDFE